MEVVWFIFWVIAFGIGWEMVCCVFGLSAYAKADKYTRAAKEIKKSNIIRPEERESSVEKLVNEADRQFKKYRWWIEHSFLGGIADKKSKEEKKDG